MAEKISELSGDAREQRIAELKKKMKESAAKVKAAHAAGELPTRTAAPTPAAVAEAEPEDAVAEAVVEKPAREAAPATNGAAKPKPAPAAAPKAPPKPKTEEVVAPVLTNGEMTRRELLTYAWGGALALLGAQAGLVSFQFMYPRFRAGEFGGKFFLSEAEVPPAGVTPVANTNGKFWLVTTEEGDPKALYMVCTHLGCLYKWEASNSRFECPCHGSKFTHDGHFIEGPAPRSLDTFDITIENGQVVVDTGSKSLGGPATESPARIVV